MDDSTRSEHRLNLNEAPPVPWTVRDVAWGLVVFVLWLLFLMGINLAGEQLALPIDVSLVVVFGEIILLLPVWYLTIRKYRLDWADLGLRNFQMAMVGIGCGLMLLSLVFNMIYASLLALFDLQIQPDITIIFENTGFPLLLIFGGAVVAPIIEEIFFRGFIFAGLRDRWGWQWAAIISGGLFAVAHIVPTSFLPIFILGVIFAFLYQLSGSIWPPILMHMFTNTLALSTAYAISQGWGPAP